VNEFPQRQEPARDEIIGAELRQVVRSPEQVALHLPIAGPTSRMLAYAVDLVVLLLVEAGLLVLAMMSTPFLNWLKGPLRNLGESLAKGNVRNAGDSSIVLVVIGLLLLVQFVAEWGYFVACEMMTGGRSLGKALIGLRVVRDGGLPLSLRESLVRNLLRAVDMLPSNYVTGLVAMLVSADGKRLGDLAAGTVVVRLDRPAPAPPLIDVEEHSAAFRFDHAQIARLGANERALVRQTLRRLETLPVDAAAAVLERAVEALRARIGYEPVAVAERAAFLRALLRAARR
jgi:uncharacterized RDD family membrane protein YckC